MLGIVTHETGGDVAVLGVANALEGSVVSEGRAQWKLELALDGSSGRDGFAKLDEVAARPRSYDGDDQVLAAEDENPGTACASGWLGAGATAAEFDVKGAIECFDEACGGHGLGESVDQPYGLGDGAGSARGPWRGTAAAKVEVTERGLGVRRRRLGGTTECAHQQCSKALSTGTHGAEHTVARS